MVSTEADDSITVEVKFHLVKHAGTQRRGLIIDAVVRTILHDDRFRICRKSGAGQESEHADKRQDETHEPHGYSGNLFQFFHAD